MTKTMTADQTAAVRTAAADMWTRVASAAVAAGQPGISTAVDALARAWRAGTITEITAAAGECQLAMTLAKTPEVRGTEFFSPLGPVEQAPLAARSALAALRFGCGPSEHVRVLAACARVG